MTEAEWFACKDPTPMFELLQSRASDRKLQLFAVACCKRAWRLMSDQRQRDAVKAAEQKADGLLTEAEFEAILEPIVALWADLPETAAKEGGWGVPHYMIAAVRQLGTGGGASYAASYVARAIACSKGNKESAEWRAAMQVEDASQCQMLRDLFGNPFLPFRFDPHWLSGVGSAAVERAREIYREGRLQSLATLGDALEQAGCSDRLVLDHCRSAGPHIRGCWVIDALLGRESAVRTGFVSEADWQKCVDSVPLLHFLRDNGSERKWRLFAVACCRRISHLLADKRSREAVEVAERFADDAATAQEIEAARSSAQEAQDFAKREEYAAEAAANFCMTPTYAVSCCRLFAASAARSALCRDTRKTDGEPRTYEADYWRPSNHWAAAAIGTHAFAQYSNQQSDDRHDEARRAEYAKWAAEIQAQCGLLRDVFGHYLGPVGNEDAWLPAAPPINRRTAHVEQWCLLPEPKKLYLRPAWLTWNNGSIPKLAQTIYDDRAFNHMPALADALIQAGCTNEDILAHCRSSGEHVRGCWVIDLLLGRE